METASGLEKQPIILTLPSEEANAVASIDDLQSYFGDRIFPLLKSVDAVVVPRGIIDRTKFNLDTRTGGVSSGIFNAFLHQHGTATLFTSEDTQGLTLLTSAYDAIQATRETLQQKAQRWDARLYTLIISAGKSPISDFNKILDTFDKEVSAETADELFAGMKSLRHILRDNEALLNDFLNDFLVDVQRNIRTTQSIDWRDLDIGAIKEGTFHGRNVLTTLHRGHREQLFYLRDDAGERPIPRKFWKPQKQV